MLTLTRYISNQTHKLLIATVVLMLASHAFAEKSNDDEFSLEGFLQEQNMEPETESSRILYRNFDSWKRIDNHHLLATTKRDRESYIISFKNPCYELDKGSAISFKSGNSFISKMDSVYIVDQFDITDIGSNGIPEKVKQVCNIEDIVKLHSTETNTEAG